MDAAFDTVAVVEAAAVAAGVKADDLELAPQHNTIKGGLYLILSKTLLYPCLRDWKYLTRFALCLGRAQLVDKVCWLSVCAFV